MSGDETVYVDATDQIAGRLSSKVAKLILSGKNVVVVNAERALVSGSRTAVVTQWKERLELGSKVNPIYGPIHPRRPDNILRRMVSVMVPIKMPIGVSPMKRLWVYIGVPAAVKPDKMTRFEDAAASRPIPVYVTMADLSRSLGWNE